MFTRSFLVPPLWSPMRNMAGRPTKPHLLIIAFVPRRRTSCEFGEAGLQRLLSSLAWHGSNSALAYLCYHTTVHQCGASRNRDGSVVPVIVSDSQIGKTCQDPRPKRKRTSLSYSDTADRLSTVQHPMQGEQTLTHGDSRYSCYVISYASRPSRRSFPSFHQESCNGLPLRCRIVQWRSCISLERTERAIIETAARRWGFSLRFEGRKQFHAAVRASECVSERRNWDVASCWRNRVLRFKQQPET